VTTGTESTTGSSSATDADVTGAADGRPLWLPFVALTAAIVVLDQLAKAWLVSILRPGESQPVIGDLLRLVNSQNNGGLFGLLHGQALPFAALSLVVIGLIVLYHARSGRSPYLTLTLGLLLGGAIGNLVDRVRLGYVVDFVDAGIGNLRWYTFNVADAAISFAILLLIAASLRPALTAWNPGRRAPAAADGDGAAAGAGEDG
jgi:signal peptidase II